MNDLDKIYQNLLIEDERFKVIVQIIKEEKINMDMKSILEMFKDFLGNSSIYTKKDNIDYISKKPSVGELFDLSDEKFYNNKEKFLKYRSKYPIIDSHFKEFYILLKDIELLK